MKLPDWHKLLKLLKEMSLVIPQFKLLGWDLAHTKNGWVLVEVNARPHSGTAQVSSINGRRKQFEEIEKLYELEVGIDEE